MKIKLINTPDFSLSATEQVLINRGISYDKIHHYLNTTDNDINPPEALGETALKHAARILIQTIQNDDRVLVIVDSDCDGFTSAAVLINYLYDLFPAFVINNVDWVLHQGKQHGIDTKEFDLESFALANYKLIICPDSSSNDYDQHLWLCEHGVNTIVLDHHEAEAISDHAYVINNQLCDYPNKELSGVGVTWQFCRYLDSILGKNYANDYLDLVALGNMADMMSMTSIETKHLIHKGFQAANVKNPFIFEMANKNSYSLNKGDYQSHNDLMFTPMGAAFFIAPFVNAMVRSGTQEEKELIFNSMIKFKAFEIVPSTKRGHRPGETERVVDQALRTCTNVKNRQTRAQDTGLEFLEGMIEEQNLMQHKVLLFLLEPGQVDRNIAGLIANKFMAKYQRPVCILTKVEEIIATDVPGRTAPLMTKRVSYQGSARGYDASGITNFKDICAAAPGVIFAQGHQGAFGLGIDADEIESFLEATDVALANMSSEPSYFVDYIFDANNVDTDKILEIARMNDYWGKNIDRAFICIKGLKVCDNNFQVMKGNTLKFKMPNVDIIKFGGTDDEVKKFSTEGYVEIDCVCQCCINEWPQFVYNPQLMMVDYEIVDSQNYYF
jgi:single-stranded-DNA-specific exonuclease